MIFPLNYTMAYFAKMSVVADSSEQHKIQLVIRYRSEMVKSQHWHFYFIPFKIIALFFCTPKLIHIPDLGLTPSLYSLCQLPGWHCSPFHQQKRGIWNSTENGILVGPS